MDPESVVNAFYTVLYDGLNQFVPVFSSHLHSNFKKKMYSFKIRKLMTRKGLLWSIYRRLKTPESLSRYKLIAAKCRSAIHNFHLERENRIINSDNLGKFFNYANSKFNCKSSVGPLRSADGSLSTDPNHKAELLQTVFKSAFTPDNGYIYLHSLMSLQLS